jgi:hypothetical protein
LYEWCLVAAALSPLALAPAAPGALVGLVAAPLAVQPFSIVGRPGAGAPALVKALIGTARFEVVLAVLLAVGLWSW